MDHDEDGLAAVAVVGAVIAWRLMPPTDREPQVIRRSTPAPAADDPAVPTRS